MWGALTHNDGPPGPGFQPRFSRLQAQCFYHWAIPSSFRFKVRNNYIKYGSNLVAPPPCSVSRHWFLIYLCIVYGDLTRILGITHLKDQVRELILQLPRRYGNERSLREIKQNLIQTPINDRRWLPYLLTIYRICWSVTWSSPNIADERYGALWIPSKMYWQPQLGLFISCGPVHF